jgi:hypothetical protein
MEPLCSSIKQFDFCSVIHHPFVRRTVILPTREASIAESDGNARFERDGEVVIGDGAM